ncbi:hypothetical protein C8A03DRAFT_19932 [Achaetomium macrosporum]|uniref:Uncharacterized protein n=1 Tax=Achaetomium macrosporum TaxID=79813 RepID=A0AAN7H6D8_9PEZI|nr:hypothetical protein C8A03DRAFT_19932 [Achaetomium macrosporum]
MCFYERIQFKCGPWKWGRFREQCNKEYRIGETCGLKQVFTTRNESRDCASCTQITKKQRRIRKMMTDIERWRREGDHPATVEKTERELTALQCAISTFRERHGEGQFGGSQQRRKSARTLAVRSL